MQTTQDRPAQLDGLEVKDIKTIRLADGEHQVSQCEIVPFGVGESHSPFKAQFVTQALRYTEGGQTWRAPLDQILAYSDGQSPRHQL